MTCTMFWNILWQIHCIYCSTNIRSSSNSSPSCLLMSGTVCVNWNYNWPSLSSQPLWILAFLFRKFFSTGGTKWGQEDLLNWWDCPSRTNSLTFWRSIWIVSSTVCNRVTEVTTMSLLISFLLYLQLVGCICSIFLRQCFLPRNSPDCKNE